MIQRGPASSKHTRETESKSPRQKETTTGVETIASSGPIPSNNEVAQTLTSECQLASSIVQQWLARMSSAAPASSTSASPSPSLAIPTLELQPSVKKASIPPPAEPEIRPARLGLGAQYLPHQRAVKLEDNVARRLQRHIESKDGRARRTDGSFDDEDKSMSVDKRKKQKAPEEAKKTDLRQTTTRKTSRPLDGLLGKKTLPKKKQRST